MTEIWPALCTALALALLLVLIIRYQVHAFAGLLLVSLALGLATGMEPGRVVDAIGKGVGDILRDVALILALGAMLGRMLEISGAAEVIARTLISVFGAGRAPLAILVAGYLIGIPVLFNVGFLLLMPIMWRLQKQTGESLLYYSMPLAFSLGVTHSLVPTHPGIAGAVAYLGGPDPGKTMIQTIVFGSLMSVPLILVGWFGLGRFWARSQYVGCPAALSAEPKPNPAAAEACPRAPVSFGVAVLIVTLPLLLGLAGFGAQLLEGPRPIAKKGVPVPAAPGELPRWLTDPPLDRDSLPPYLAWLGHPPLAWLQFVGKPAIALLVPTCLAFWLLGLRRGLHGAKLAKVAEDGLRDVGSIAFLFGAAGGFKEVIQATGAGDIIAKQMMSIPGLSPVAIAYLVAVLMRVALGSATASILTASALLQGLAKQFPGQEALIVLAVASGVIFMSQPADSGFWMVKEYSNLSVRDTLIRYNACKILMSLAGFAMLLVVEAWL
ncbi:MAG TPA: SLC13 family permease [Gemmataceae bacterium]|nr:SLC13 family permease [Gemmataceae bacterium]